MLGWLLGVSWPGRRLRLAISGHRGPCNYTLSEWAQQRVRILCMVAARADQWGPSADISSGQLQPHNSSADAVRGTWWARCDHLLFLSSRPHPVVPTVVMDTSKTPWSQMRTAFEFVVNKTEWHFDWILKVDDKAFVVMENLRRLLMTRAPYRALFTGALLGDYKKTASAGYVISREAASKLVTAGPNHTLCHSTTEEEEGLVLCMAAVGGQFFIAKDDYGLCAFYEVPPEALMEDVLQGKRVDQCCSTEPALFSGLLPGELRATYYLLYRLKPRHPTTCGTLPRLK
ncbi:glycoprotein-N-acetylgalactosamine 3-beta-galactosyltransferase 1-like [Schistocerca nitens]|uniref:glycoprotein-N-acetylgalactosamine 3-beta-galactosyltransferase 1-like n=1 Tax=Schistocerca nitens TaxID=7011 RepID=UPI0021180DDF|nr:glycoprotein-N-acetylgalactosamine 3-beta-galactosyltransferase 1-like [Schistocerca nitens]